MQGPRQRLGQLLIDAHIITDDQLDAVLSTQASDGRRLGALLVEAGLVAEAQLTQILSQQLSVPWVSLRHIDFSRQLLNLVPRDLAERWSVVPIHVRHTRGQGDTLYVAMDDPTDDEALAAVAGYAGLATRPMLAAASEIRHALRVYYGVGPTLPAAAAAAAAEPDAPAPAPDAATATGPEVAASPSPAPPKPAPSEPSEPAAPTQRPPAGEAQAPVMPSPSKAPTIVVPAPAEEPPAAIPEPVGGRAPRMVALTLLDGTTLRLPAARRRRAVASIARPHEPAESVPDGEHEQLTARDLVAALRAASQGADASEVLDDVRWERLFAALLSVLLRKHLIADWEFVEEMRKR